MAESELLKLTGVGPKAAKTLEDCGYNTIEKITKATADELSQLPGIGKATAEKIIASAKDVLKATKPSTKKASAETIPKTKVEIKKEDIPKPKTSPKVQVEKSPAKKTEPRPSVKTPASKPKVVTKPTPAIKKEMKKTVTYVKPYVSQATKDAIETAPAMLTIKKDRIKKKKAKKKAKISTTYGIINSIVHDRAGKSANRSVIMNLYDTELPLERYLGRKVLVSLPNTDRKFNGTIIKIHGKRTSSDKSVIVRFSQGVSPHILAKKAQVL